MLDQKRYLELLKEQAAVRIPVRHPGFLEVPEGKDVDDLPMSHFQKLIKKHSWPAVSKALINLKVWNQKRNPKLAKWADDMQEKLAKWVEKERETKGDENLYEQVRIPVKHPGILDVPSGKNVEDLPMSHFQKLIKKHSWPTISKALINLKVWNQKRDPKLAKWADDMQEKLAKWVEKEREEKKNPDLYEK